MFQTKHVSSGLAFIQVAGPSDMEVASVNGNALKRLGFHTITITRCITFMFEVDSAEQSEEHSMVRFDLMDKFKRGCEFTIDFSRKMIHNLGSIVHGPKSVRSGHLNVSDAGSSHSNKSLPILFNQAILV